MANNKLYPLIGNRSREAHPGMEVLATFPQQDFRIMSSNSPMLPFLPLLGIGIFIGSILSLFEHYFKTHLNSCVCVCVCLVEAVGHK